MKAAAKCGGNGGRDLPGPPPFSVLCRTVADYLHLLKSGRLGAQKLPPYGPGSCLPSNLALTTFDLVMSKREFGQFAFAAAMQAATVEALSLLSHDFEPPHLLYDSDSLPGQAVRLMFTTHSSANTFDVYDRQIKAARMMLLFMMLPFLYRYG